jgi:hypothetical protein
MAQVRRVADAGDGVPLERDPVDAEAVTHSRLDADPPEDDGCAPDLADPDDDRLLWLEAVEGARATAWADAQSRTTMARWGDARFAADRDALCRLLDRPDNLPVPTRRGHSQST